MERVWLSAAGEGSAVAAPGATCCCGDLGGKLRDLHCSATSFPTGGRTTISFPLDGRARTVGGGAAVNLAEPPQPAVGAWYKCSGSPRRGVEEVDSAHGSEAECIDGTMGVDAHQHAGGVTGGGGMATCTDIFRSANRNKRSAL